MFWNKKKEVTKKHIEITKPTEFKIPQIPNDTVGLRVFKSGFKKTEAASPMEGNYTKDVVVVPEFDSHQDIDLVYDSFRVEKKLTKEDEIKRYGRAYHEFNSVDEVLNTDEYEAKVVEKQKNEASVGIDFGIVYDADSMIKEEPKVEEQIPVNPNIHFGEPYAAPKQEVEFKPIEVDNELKEEQNNMFAKPTPRVFDFTQTVNYVPPVEDNTPKTIIIERPRIQEVELEEILEPLTSIPPFVNEKNNEVEEIKIFDSPSVETSKNEDIYDHIRSQNEKKIIHVDKYSDYKYPPISLLNPVNRDSIVEPDWIQDKIASINETLLHFGVDGEVVDYTYGPTVTRYEVKLNFGVNVKKITNIADNIKMSLCAKSIRIEAPIPGKSNVGIEVPNPSVRTVAFAELAERDEFLNGKDKYNIVLGIDINGDPVYTSVAKMPHGLIAGTTGSGKSVCLNGLLISLLLRNSPTDLRLVLVDPKVVEFGDYQDLPHLATPVITNVKLASEALKWATEEMDRRFIAFQAAHVRDLPTYNNKVKNDPSLSPLPRIVVVIEEFADLIMTCGNDVESSIQRITQMGRAAGIHLILATQRPTTDIVKGSIKTNIQCRIAFRVVDYTASTTILGGAGAEELLGRGDMLFKVEDLPTRIQGAYISDEEIQGVCEYIRSNYKPDYLFTHEDLQNKVKDAYGANNKENSEDMELVYSVAVYVVERGSCSINSIQTTFSLGFRRASNIVDILEEMGIVGASKGTTGREILVTLAEVDQKFKVGH